MKEEIDLLIDNIKKFNSSSQNGFDIIKKVVNLYNKIGFTKYFYNVFFTLLENRDKFNNYNSIINSLIRDVGLFPYIEEDKIDSFKDAVALNSFICPKIKEGKTIFHFPQAKVFYTILSGQSVILSAPTSFGKSLIIDAIISKKVFKNIVIVVPTIALIDETRKRLNVFSDYYKIITHPTQSKKENNIYILTQERAILDNFIDKVDFFVIDEFYKLNPQGTNQEDSRCDILNLVFYKLYKKCKHFYMLGPNIDGLTERIEESISYIFFKEKFPTVGTSIYREKGEATSQKIYDIFLYNKEQTLVYCNTPKSVMDLANGLILLKPLGNYDPMISDLCSWIANTYHADWSLIKYLQHRIGVHHARLPRALGQLIIELFNMKKLDILLCTSTIIEGVNTSAKNVIIRDQKIGTNDLDFFTFNNIAGRAGRMFKHFIGNVFIFSDQPQEQLPYVDIPVISQNSETSVNILLGMDVNDLDDSSYHKVEKFYDQSNLLSVDTLKKNPQINPESQLHLAKDIVKNKLEWHNMLYWTSMPTYDQLYFVCDLMFKYFNAESLAYKTVTTPKQLCFFINRLCRKNPIKNIIKSDINNRKIKGYQYSVDYCISQYLNFIRLWALHHFPTLLMCISYIQDEIYKKFNMPVGDYSYYAMSVESLFYDPALICLEEYGIPLEISRKIEENISADGNLDLTINKLKSINIHELSLTQFEKKFLEQSMKYI